ncbi:conserved hypothetical membrane protein [Microseira wollei NIES-4236]|uniref:Conserved hypothetical membrane protein n=2 Tax=Microseira wollei TaxID=467598 RepID=A0AAV3XFV3_9CYAN|nr:conserved hypothetical membrane protein [Microseira wollei NIES-4236]
MMFLRGIVIWLVLMFAEILHGTARTLWLAPYVGDFRARQISVFTGSILMLIIAIAFVRALHASRASQLLAIGLLWLLLTIAFEIGLGRFVFAYSWERIASEYNLLAGGLMPIGLVVLTLSPLIAGKVRGVID